MTEEWIELRCPRSLRAKLHPGARVIEIACHQGQATRHGTHEMDWFDADTGRRLTEHEVWRRVHGAPFLLRRVKAWFQRAA